MTGDEKRATCSACGRCLCPTTAFNRVLCPNCGVRKSLVTAEWLNSPEGRRVTEEMKRRVSELKETT